jgi:hypothetical protein
MKRTITILAFASLIVLPGLAAAVPIGGIYTSTDLGGQVLTGRASTWRAGINSGLPHVLHAQSWDGTTVGTQWDVSCATENANFQVEDNRVAGVGTVVYTSTFTGGTFTLFAGGWPWGDGVGTLGTTALITTVQFINIGGISTPVASVVNGNTAGEFSNGCRLTFVIANGAGVGETTSLNPAIVKPPTYPTFQDGTCAPAAGNAQFGSWGNVLTLTMAIDCTVAATPVTWSHTKSLYR